MINTSMSLEIKSKILKVSLGMVGYAALLILTSGKWDWLWGWVYIILLTLAMATHVLVLMPINPALLADRAGGLRQPGTKRFRRNSMGIPIMPNRFAIV
ncbi:MAG: hypothetical protein JW963_03480 [Anaerolineales bacterium]|nr:hypothetical protein [Anaerolineales bacterium]